MAVVLFDLSKKGRCAAWSHNPWKTRLALNFKGVDYSTEWTELVDVAATLKRLGVTPNEEGPPYTIPTVRFGSEYVMDSQKIADALESRYPSPSLHLDNPALRKVEETRNKILWNPAGIMALMGPIIPEKLLQERSREYEVSKQEEHLGMPVEQWVAQTDRDKAWDVVCAGLAEWVQILKEHPGPFCLGDTVSYADFLIVSMFYTCKLVDEELFNNMLAFDETLGAVYNGCEKWLAKDD